MKIGRLFTVRSLSRAGADAILRVVITAVTYRVIYDAAQLRFPAWPVSSVGLAVALAGVGLGAYLRHRGITSAAARTVVTSAIIFGVSWSLLVGGGLYAQHGQLRSALEERSFVSVEGVVYDSPQGSGAAKDVDGKSWLVESGRRHTGIATTARHSRSVIAAAHRGPGACATACAFVLRTSEAESLD